MQTNQLGIDVKTHLKKAIIRALQKLKTTESVKDGGEYHADHEYSQVHIETTMTEDALDMWFYTRKDVECVGVFQRESV